MIYYIFISHINTEKDLAIGLKNLLKSVFGDKVEIFVSSDFESLPPGTNFIKKLKEKINQANLAILLCSENSLNDSKKWVPIEAGAFIFKDIDIVPICHSGMTPEKLPPAISMQIQAMLLEDEYALKALFNKLAKKLKFSITNINLKKMLSILAKHQSEEHLQNKRLISKQINSAKFLKKFITPKNDWKSVDYKAKVSLCLTLGLHKEAKKIYDKYNLNNKKSLDLAEFNAIYYSKISVNADQAYFNEVYKLYEKYPNNPSINSSLALIYEKCHKNYKKSKEHLIKAIKNSKDNDKIAYYSHYIRLLSNDGNFEECDKLLKNIKQSLPNPNESIMLDILIDLSNKKKSHLEFIALNEKKVSLTNDITLRFELASKYSDQKEYNAALLHYKICNDIKINHAFANNLGVAYSELDMPSKAIDMYQLSLKNGGDVAIGNLANIFHESNFLTKAHELCFTGIEEKKDIARLSEFLAKINKQIESENSKERSCIFLAEQLQKYNLEYADACLDKLEFDINGVWYGDGYEITIITKDNQMTAEGVFDTSKINKGLGLLSGYLALFQSKKTRISYKGLLSGRGIAFYLSTSSLDKSSNLATADYQFTPGLMILKDINTICVYEKESTCKQQFYTLNRK